MAVMNRGVIATEFNKKKFHISSAVKDQYFISYDHTQQTV